MARLDSRIVADATDLAQLLGSGTAVVELIGVLATRATRSEPLTIDKVVEEADSVSRDIAQAFFEFLLSRGYAVEDGDPSALDTSKDDCLNLLSATWTARRVLDHASSETRQPDVEFVCTLPESDPSFRGHDPIDFDMQQITTRLLSLCKEATDELVLTSPFLELEGIDWLIPGLKGALERGVEVTLVSRELQSGRPNHSVVGELFEIASGVPGQLEVYDYYEPIPDDDRPKYTLHSKLLVVDRHIAYVGSANFTKYGFTENLEIGVVVDAPEVEPLQAIIAHLVANRAVRVTP